MEAITLEAIKPPLNEGEHWAGISIDEDGTAHQLILLPGEAERVNHADAIEFAKKAGGDLPTRREQALLYANLKGQFKPGWHWSGEQHADYSGCAWFQGFGNGGQFYGRKSDCLRARAVRRSPI